MPRTLVTNRPAAALAFLEEIGGDLAIKSLGAISVITEGDNRALQYGIFTRRLTEAELLEFSDKISYMPTQFQEFIAKKSELRITCIGEHIFACRIEPRSEDITSDDYRFDTANLLHAATECPELVERIRAYMHRLNLNFGCFDFIVPQSGGEAIFLECNCNGQWYWVEERTGQPIGKAIALELLRHATCEHDLRREAVLSISRYS